VGPGLYEVGSKI
jgi:hypothetical protein